MGTALGGGNQVDVAFHDGIAALWQPLDGPIHRFLITGETAGEGLKRHGFDVCQGSTQVVPQAVLIEPLVFLAGFFLQECHHQARAQHRLGPQIMPQTANGEIGTVEVFRIGGELQAGTGVALANGINHLQLGGLVAVGKGHPVNLAIPPDGHFQMGRQGIHHRHTHTVQAAGEVIVALGKLTTGVQAGEDQLNPRNALFLVDIDGHTAAIVFHTQRIVTVQDHINPAGMAGQRLVHTVIDDFLSQVVRP